VESSINKRHHLEVFIHTSVLALLADRGGKEEGVSTTGDDDGGEISPVRLLHIRRQLPSENNDNLLLSMANLVATLI
jgi:hypothetical protein